MISAIVPSLETTNRMCYVTHSLLNWAHLEREKGWQIRVLNSGWGTARVRQWNYILGYSTPVARVIQGSKTGLTGSI